jgi:hypothetical protein
MFVIAGFRFREMNWESQFISPSNIPKYEVFVP